MTVTVDISGALPVKAANLLNRFYRHGRWIATCQKVPLAMVLTPVVHELAAGSAEGSHNVTVHVVGAEPETMMAEGYVSG